MGGSDKVCEAVVSGRENGGKYNLKEKSSKGDISISLTCSCRVLAALYVTTRHKGCCWLSLII